MVARSLTMEFYTYSEDTTCCISSGLDSMGPVFSTTSTLGCHIFCFTGNPISVSLVILLCSLLFCDGNGTIVPETPL